MCYIDVNECEGVNDCQQLCENTIGSYDCACSEGFTLAEDGKGCNGKTHSKIINDHLFGTMVNGLFLHTANVPCGGGCSFGCAVIDGEEQCYCQIGFELSSPGGTQCVGILSL